MSTELTKTDANKLTIVKNDNAVSRALNRQEADLGQHVAMKALKLVEPMIASVSDELTNTLGDNETIIVIRVVKRGSPATILMLDTSEDFTIKGAKANGGKFLFTGEADGVTKKPRAVKRHYVIREFVDMLLTGRMQELTEKLMK